MIPYCTLHHQKYLPVAGQLSDLSYKIGWQVVTGGCQIALSDISSPKEVYNAAPCFSQVEIHISFASDYQRVTDWPVGLCLSFTI